jgi:hypothetical protein
MNTMKYRNFLAALLVFSALANAGEMRIDSVIVDSSNGKTFSAACQNTKGYFAELGQRGGEARLILDARFDNEQLRNVLRKSIPRDWNVEYGKALPTALAIDWSGRASWVDVLSELSRTNNLVVVIAWAQKSVYIDKL